jgi:hypothetical protein
VKLGNVSDNPKINERLHKLVNRKRKSNCRQISKFFNFPCFADVYSIFVDVEKGCTEKVLNERGDILVDSPGPG